MPAKKSAINTLGQQMCTKVLVSWYTSQLNNIRGENLNSVQEFVKIQSWLLLIILECLHYQISLIIKFYNSIKSTDSSSRQKMDGFFLPQYGKTLDGCHLNTGKRFLV